jgi:hypothetical protein
MATFGVSAIALVIMLLVFTILAMSLFFGYKFLSDPVILRRRGIVTQGRCVRLKWHDGDASSVIEFATEDGREMVTSTPSKYPPAVGVGQTCHIVYDPRNPKRSDLHPPKLSLGAGIPLIVFGVGGLAGLIWSILFASG